VPWGNPNPTLHPIKGHEVCKQIAARCLLNLMKSFPCFRPTPRPGHRAGAIHRPRGVATPAPPPQPRRHTPLPMGRPPPLPALGRMVTREPGRPWRREGDAAQGESPPPGKRKGRSQARSGPAGGLWSCAANLPCKWTVVKDYCAWINPWLPMKNYVNICFLALHEAKLR